MRDALLDGDPNVAAYVQECEALRKRVGVLEEALRKVDLMAALGSPQQIRDVVHGALDA